MFDSKRTNSRLGWNEVESQLRTSPEPQNAGITLRSIPAYGPAGCCRVNYTGGKQPLQMWIMCDALEVDKKGKEQ